MPSAIYPHFLEQLTSLETLRLSWNPILDYGPLRRLQTANPGVTIDIDLDNNLPVFADSDPATRSVAENTAAGINIGDPISATDADSDPLTYSLGGIDAESFRIVSASGQLQTHAALDFETQSSYTVTVTVYDGNSGGARITVSITVTDVDEGSNPNTPVFTEGTTATRTVAENTASGQNIGNPVAATDADNDVLTYRLSGTDAAAFGIVSTSGQLQTKAALDYETKSSYSVTVSVADGKGGTDSIDVTISVTNVDEINPPLRERTQEVQDAIVAAVSGVDSADDVTGTHLAAITSLSFADQNITSLTSGDFNGLTALTTLNLEGNSLSDISVLEQLTSLTTLQLANNDIKDISPLEQLTSLTTLQLDANIISNISVLEQLTSLTTLHLSRNTTLSDISVLQQLTALTTLNISYNAITDISILQHLTALTTLDISYNDISDVSVLQQLTALTDLDLVGNPISAYDFLRQFIADNPNVNIDINLTNNPPVFSEGDSTIRSIAENTASGQNIGDPISATDADTGDTLTYSFAGWHFGNAESSFFSIDTASGQLKTREALDYDIKASYTVIVDVSDGNDGLDRITVTINVTEEATSGNNAPRFTDRTTSPRTGRRSIQANTPTRSVAENTAPGQNIGNAVAATDRDGDTLTYTLGGTDADAFSIVSTSGQLQTKAALDFETKKSYSVTVSVSDGKGGSDAIDVTINVTDVNDAPIFTDGDSTTRSVAENTTAGQNIGNAVAATDQDRISDPDNEGQFLPKDTLTYTLSGDDATAFDIVSTSGQLQTKAALDFETDNTYEVTVTASDGKGGTDSITVTINVTNVDEINPPLNERTPQVQDAIVAAVPGVDNADDVTDTHLAAITSLSLNAKGITSLKSEDFNGLTALTDLQLANNALSDLSPLEQLTSLTVLSLSGNPILDYGPLRSLQAANPDVAIDVNLDNTLPVFADSDPATRTIAENTDAGTNIGDPISATDADSDTLTYSLGGTDADSFDIVSTSGQLQTKAALDFETQSSYTVTVTAYDGNSGGARIDVTINVTDVNEDPNNAPVFTDGDSTTRTIAENTAAEQNIGTAVVAIDADTGDTLTYTLSGDDAASFSIISTSGQLQTKAALDFETKSSYTVTVSVADDNDGSDSIDVTISVTDANDAPVFTDGDTTTRAIAENTAAEQNIGTAVSATDVDSETTLTYTLGGTDADAFSIVSTSGQLQTKAALDYETKKSYSVTVSVADGNGGNDSIDVTISVTDANDAPIFTDGDSTTRTVAENTAAEQNIGTAIAATDADNDTLTYTLGGTDAAAFSIVSTSGQLQTKNTLDFETKNTYTVTVAVADGNGGSGSITVTINVTDVNEAPRFSKTQVTLSVAEDATVGTPIGTPFQATDPDGDTLTYSLRRADADAFSIDASTGQLKTNIPLDYEVKKVYDNLAVRATDADGKFDAIVVTVNITDVVEVPVAQFVPFKNALLPNFPNPFNPETWIPYQLSKPAEVTLTIYNMRGVVVRQLKLGHQAAGFYHNRSRAIHWDGRNMFGEKVATGVYFYTLKAGDYTATRKLLIRK